MDGLCRSTLGEQACEGTGSLRSLMTCPTPAVWPRRPAVELGGLATT
jgi:hypothetical protein